jgi:hypothetical protein
MLASSSAIDHIRESMADSEHEVRAKRAA